MSRPRLLKIQRYISALAARGITGPQLSAAQLAQPDDLSLPDYLAIVQDITAVAPPDFALSFGAARRLPEMGVVGHAIQSCGTLGEALNIWMNFSDLSGDPLRCRSTIEGDTWSLEFRAVNVLSPSAARFCAEEFAACFFRFAADITEIDRADSLTEFQHRAAPDVDYANFLPGPVHFRCVHNRIRMPATVLAALVLTRDDETFNLLIEHFKSRRPGESQNSTASQMRQYLMAATGKSQKLADVAQALGISARTLNRKLTDEGTTFTRVLAEFRNDYAQALAREGTLGAKQIAHAVGFRTHQSLRRAFANWNGQPLGEWRTAHSPARRQK